MVNGHKLEREAAAADCRSIIQSENEGEAIELARKFMREVHGQRYTDEELQEDHLQVVLRTLAMIVLTFLRCVLFHLRT
jgi:hypothetical protein